MIRILFLAANPVSDEPPLQLYKEFESIDDNIWESNYRDNFEVIPRFTPSLNRLHKYIIRFKPTILHFSGHGTSKGSLVFLNEKGKKQVADLDIVKNIFEVVGTDIKCVILNACYSKSQANLLSQYVDCIIGISGAILDLVAITFTTAFYYAVCSGKSVLNAFKLAKIQVSLLTIIDKNGKIIDIHKQTNMIEIMSKKGIDLSKLILIGKKIEGLSKNE